MTKQGHYKTGAGLALCAGSAVLSAGYSPAQSGIVILLATASAALPDTMEIKWWRAGIRHSVIPHRTLTHWLAPWCIAAFWSVCAGMNHTVNPYAAASLTGIAAGAIGHNLMDWLSPMGIPVLSPIRRSSLHLIHSGNPATETGVAILTLITGISALAVTLWSR